MIHRQLYHEPIDYYEDFSCVFNSKLIDDDYKQKLFGNNNDHNNYSSLTQTHPITHTV